MKIIKVKDTANPKEKRSGPSQEGLSAACPALTSPLILHVAGFSCRFKVLYHLVPSNPTPAP